MNDAADDEVVTTAPSSDARRLSRAWALTHGFANSLHRVRAALVATPTEPEWFQFELLRLAVPDFCDWCAIDVFEVGGEFRRLALRHRDCCEEHGESHDKDCNVGSRVDGLEWHEKAQRAMSSGRTQVRGASGDGSPYFIVPLRVNGQPFGVITFANDLDSPDLDQIEVVAAEQVCWSLVDVIDRQRLTGANREAARQTQRIARQLHQLIAASITVAGMSTEREILRNLAGSTRSVFDGELAIVSLEDGNATTKYGVARRGKVPMFASDDEELAVEVPPLRPRANEPWLEGDWLVAPILERRDRARGVVAVRRLTPAIFGAEDREVLTLLTQMASSALGAHELAKSIEQSEGRLRTLIDTAPIGIVEVDLAGRVRYWNPAAERILAWSTYSSQIAAPQFPESMRPELDALWSEVLSGEAVNGRDIVGVEVGGRARILTVSGATLPSVDDGEPGILTLVDDVTNHRELTAELRHAHTMEVRGQVASRIAHDFNNLLTLISGYAEILSRELSFDDRLGKMIADIQATASRASLLTGQLQTIGRTKIAEPVVFDPAVIMESNAEVLERILGPTIELQWALDEFAGNVRVDPDQFEQMILNLAMNARDAMPDGGRLRFSVEPATLDDNEAVERGLTPGEYVKFLVTDSGVGMDDSTRERCFEPLFTTKGPYKGTGMGLASARRLVDESGGSIRCRSRLGEGTTFDIVLPSVSGPVAETSVQPDVARARGDASVLIVEDDDGLRRLMSQVLRRNGYEVTDAESGEHAMALVAEATTPIDLLLSDVVMGGMNGRDLAFRLQSMWPDLRVLLVSGTADSTIADGLRQGSSDFLPKPFKPSQLIDRVHELLSRPR